MLYVDGRDYADTCIQYLHDVLPAFGIRTPFDIGMCQLIYYDNFWMLINDCLRIHLLKFLPFIEKFPSRN